MSKGNSGAVALTVRVDADLLGSLDREVARLEAQTGLRLGRAACVLAVLRRGLAATPLSTPIAAVVETHVNQGTVRTLKIAQASVPTPEAPKAKPRLVTNTTAPHNEDSLRRRCRAYCKAHRGTSNELATLLKMTVGAVRMWWTGKRSLGPGKLTNAARWLEKRA